MSTTSPSSLRTWLAMFGVAAGLFIGLLDLSIVTIVVPEVGRALDAGFTEMSWVVNVYAPTALHVVTAWRPARISEFAIGMAAGYVIVHRPRLLREYITAPADVAGIVVLGLVALIAGTRIEWANEYLSIINGPLAIAGLSAIALVLIVKAPGLLEENPLGRLLAWVGVLSYAMLIVNEPMRLVHSAVRENVSHEWWWAFLVVVYVPVGALLAWPLAKVLGLLPAPRPAPPIAERTAPALAHATADAVL